MDTYIFRSDGEHWRRPVDPENPMPEEVYLSAPMIPAGDLCAPVVVSGVTWPAPFRLSDLSLMDRPYRLLVRNGFGTGIGDMLCATPALEALYGQIKDATGTPPEIVLIVHETRMPSAIEIFGRNPGVSELRPGVIPVSEAARFDGLLDMHHFTNDERFNHTPFNEFWCRRCGLPPEAWPKDMTPRIYPSERTMQEVKKQCEACRNAAPNGSRFLALNLFGGPVRSIPGWLWVDLITRLAKRWIVCLVAGPNEWAFLPPLMDELPDKVREKVVDMSPTCSESLDHLAGCLSYMADVVVTPDTSVLHMAAGIKKPTVAIFSTIEPRLRTSGYNTVLSYCPDAFRKGALWGMSKTEADLDLMRTMAFIAPWSAVRVKDIAQLAEEAIRL